MTKTLWIVGMFATWLASGQALAVFPEPPRQKAPWEPPANSTILRKWTSAISELRELGLADPRGCAYRHVTIDVGRERGVTERLRTRAWVLPDGDGEFPHAVLWNGWVYPVLETGEPAPLAEDVQALAAEGFEERWWLHSPLAKPSAVHDSRYSVKIALLCLLGEEDLAQKLIGRWDDFLDSYINDRRTHREDPFAMLAMDWLWAGFDLARQAHVRGDDEIAYRLCARVSQLRGPAIKATERRGLRQKDDVPRSHRWFQFYDDVRRLLADQERRRNAKTIGPLPQLGELTVAEKITRLEDLAVVFPPNSLSDPMREDPLYESIVLEGDAAVEPLIKALAHDERLSRSLHSFVLYYRHDYVIPVHAIAYHLLTDILGQSVVDRLNTRYRPQAPRPIQRDQLAAQIRGLWEIHSPISPKLDDEGRPYVPLVTEFPEAPFLDGWQPLPKGPMIEPLSKVQKPLWGPRGLVNLAKGRKVVSSMKEGPIIGELAFITDGVKLGIDGYYVEVDKGPQWIQIDLGHRSKVYAIWIWNPLMSYSIYNDVVVRASDDPSLPTSETTTLYNNDHDNSLGFGEGKDKQYVTTFRGRVIAADGIDTRYIRLYSNGNHRTPYNHYSEVEVWGRKLEGDLGLE